MLKLMIKRLLKQTLYYFLLPPKQTVASPEKQPVQEKAAQAEPSKRPPCAGLWKTPMVHVNGDVTTCCLDESLTNKLGNLNNSTLEELWNSPKINSWRRAQIEGRFEESGPLCSQCNWKSAGLLSPKEAQQWLNDLDASQ